MKVRFFVCQQDGIAVLAHLETVRIWTVDEEGNVTGGGTFVIVVANQ